MEAFIQPKKREYNSYHADVHKGPLIKKEKVLEIEWNEVSEESFCFQNCFQNVNQKRESFRN